MFFWKYRYWFRGFLMRTVALLMGSGLCLGIWWIVSSANQTVAANSGTVIGAMFWGYWAFLLLWVLLKNRPTYEDRCKIEQASAPEWKPLDAETIRLSKAVNKQLSEDKKTMFVNVSAVLIVLLCVGITIGRIVALPWWVYLLFAVPFLALIWEGVWHIRFWRGFDETTVCARIPIDHIEKEPRGGNTVLPKSDYWHYAFCYLPQGRFLFRSPFPHGEYIIVIRHRGRYRSFSEREWEQFLQ